MLIDVLGEQTQFEVDGEGEDLVVLAHGAGANMHGKLLLKLRDTLVGQGFRVACFNFLYKQQGKSLPDKMPKLMDTYRAVVEQLPESRKIILGGHSMGGRTASMLAAEGYSMDGLLLFAYPLHPAGKPEKLRDEHLPRIQTPTLCFNGTQDELCRVDLMEAVLPRLQPTWTMHWIDQADHSLHVPKSSVRNDAAVLAEIGETTRAWVTAMQ